MRKFISAVLVLIMLSGFAVQSFAFLTPEYQRDFAQAEACFSEGDCAGAAENTFKGVIHLGDRFAEIIVRRFNGIMRFIETGDIRELFGYLKQIDA